MIDQPPSLMVSYNLMYSLMARRVLQEPLIFYTWITAQMDSYLAILVWQRSHSGQKFQPARIEPVTHPLLLVQSSTL